MGKFDPREFHRLNAHRSATVFGPPHDLDALLVCIAEEFGEVGGAILGMTGEKKRKAHLTVADALDERAPHQKPPSRSTRATSRP